MNVLFLEIEMAPPVIKGLGPKLKGKKDKTSNLAFGATNVVIGTGVKLEGTGPTGTVYKWTGTVASGDIKPNGKIKVTVNCDLGDTKLFRRGRRRGMVVGAGDIIDVTFTVTNPGEAPVTSPEVVEIE